MQDNLCQYATYLSQMQHNLVNMRDNYSDINNSHVNIIMLHDDIIFLACMQKKYATLK